MSDAGAELERTKVVTEAVDQASQLVRTACDGLARAVDDLISLLPEAAEPATANAIATYSVAREVLLAQLDTMDRVKKFVGA